MDDDFINSVLRGDLIGVRLSLANELMSDPRGASFHEMLTFAESRMDGLFEPDDGRRSEKDSNQWNKNFLFQVRHELDDNFSREKLAYYEQIAKQVLKGKAEHLNEEEGQQRQQPESQKTRNQKAEEQTDNWFENHKKEVYTGVTIGGALLTAIGICVSEDDLTIGGKVALSILGVAGLALGGYLLYKETKN